MARKYDHLFPRLFGIALLLMLTGALFTVFSDGKAEAGDYVCQWTGTNLYLDGDNSGPGGVVYIVVDSSDTLENDTFLSDIIDLGDSAVSSLTMIIHLSALTKCDSCNDSLWFKFRLYATPLATASLTSATGRDLFYHTARPLCTLIMLAHGVTDTSYRFEVSADTLRKAGLQYACLWTNFTDSVKTTVCDSTSLSSVLYLIGRRSDLW